MEEVMSKPNSIAILPKGASLNWPPEVNGEHYYYSKNQMKLFDVDESPSH